MQNQPKIEDTPVFLAHISSSPTHIQQKISTWKSSQSNKPIQWLFLARDFPALEFWERSLGEEFERLRYTSLFQDIGMKLRRPYLDWVSDQGACRAGLAWWSSRVAERNTAVCPLFRNLCYLQVARFYGRREKCPILIIAESRALLGEIADLPDFKGRIKWFSCFSPMAETLKWIIWMVLVWSRYFVKGLGELFDAVITKDRRTSIPIIQEKPRVLLHACIGEGYFRKAGVPEDRYFGNLASELRALGYDVIVLPWLVNVQRSTRDAFRWFRKHSDQYIIPEDFYSIADYAWAAGVVIKHARLFKGDQVFEGVTIRHLIKEACRKSAADPEIAKFVRYFRLIKKLAKRDFHIDIFIDKFENMITEKPQVLALRKFMPDVMTVGYQHYLAPHPLLLNMFTTPEETKVAPHPDAIVCNSSFTAELFSKEGFSPEQLRVGPSMRYRYLLSQKTNKKDRGNVVLIVLPLDAVFLREVMAKAWQAFSHDKNILFQIKVHPMISREDWNRVLRDTPLSSNWDECTVEISEMVSVVKCALVAGGSTASLELLLAGVPVVMIGAETDIVMNPLAWFPELEGPVYSPDDLKRKILNVLSNYEEEASKVEAWARAKRHQCLSDINQKNIAAFVSPVDKVIKI